MLHPSVFCECTICITVLLRASETLTSVCCIVLIQPLEGDSISRPARGELFVSFRTDLQLGSVYELIHSMSGFVSDYIIAVNQSTYFSLNALLDLYTSFKIKSLR